MSTNTTENTKSTFQVIDRAISDLDETYHDHYGTPYRNSSVTDEPWYGYNAAAEAVCQKHGWTMKEHMQAFITGSWRK